MKRMPTQRYAGLWHWACLFGLGSLLLACQQILPAPSPTQVRPATTTDSPTDMSQPPTPMAATPEVTAYPALPTAPSVAAYPPATQPAILTTTPYPGRPTETPVAGVYLPFAPLAQPTPTPSPTSAPALPPTPTPYPTVDFAAAQAQLTAQGQALGYSKIGFHVGVGGNTVGIGEWMRRLDEAGVPFFLKSVDDTGPVLEAIALKQTSGVDHTIVFRTTGYDVPNYNLPAVDAARQHWQWHRDRFPPELEPYKELIWLETMNELDKARSEWLAEFALEQARLAQVEGFRWAAFGWATGEPEMDDWEGPQMLRFLRLAGENPDRIAVALHEGSLIADTIKDGYPFKVGRFMFLFDVCDRHSIPRPTVLVTEWGWQSHSLPEPGQALADIAWAAPIYAPFPQVKGVAIWHLGGGYDPIQDMAQRLIAPVTQFALTHYYPIPAPPDQASPNPALYAAP